MRLERLRVTAAVLLLAALELGTTFAHAPARFVSAAPVGAPPRQRPASSSSAQDGPTAGGTRAAHAAEAAVVASGARGSGRMRKAQQHKRQSSAGPGYADPAKAGGAMLTDVGNGLGEPINVIISGQSDPEVLTPDGLGEYLRSLYFSPGSCLGQSLGNAQSANLGDGRGATPQAGLVRYNYLMGDGGTCVESLRGGNHARFWVQNGTAAKTGAIFLAASVEMDAQHQHDIVPNGYDLGRDQLVGNATNVTGTVSPGGYHYHATAVEVPLLAGVPVQRINHGIPTDGNVAVVTVRVARRGSDSSSTTAGGGNVTSASASGGSLSSGGGGAAPSSSTAGNGTVNVSRSAAAGSRSASAVRGHRRAVYAALAGTSVSMASFAWIMA